MTMIVNQATKHFQGNESDGEDKNLDDGSTTAGGRSSGGVHRSIYSDRFGTRGCGLG